MDPYFRENESSGASGYGYYVIIKQGPARFLFSTRRHGGRGGWVVGGTMNPSPSTDRQYINFDRVFRYKAGAYAAGTRYLRGRY